MATGSKARTLAPSPISVSTMGIDADSRMSSVSGLNERPSTATVLPARSSPRAVRTLSTARTFMRSLTATTVSTMSKGRPASRAISVRAWVSLGKHDPP